MAQGEGESGPTPILLLPLPGISDTGGPGEGCGSKANKLVLSWLGCHCLSGYSTHPLFADSRVPRKACVFLAACERPWGEAAAAALSVSHAASLCALSPPAICLSFPLPLLRWPGGLSQSPHSKRTPPWGVTCWSRLTRDPLWPWGGKAPVPISPMRGKGGPSATCAVLPTWPMTRPRASSSPSHCGQPWC